MTFHDVMRGGIAQAIQRVAGQSVALSLSMLVSACSNPTSSADGPFGISTKVVTDDYYGAPEDPELRVSFRDGILVWDSPVDNEPIFGAYVELQIGSQSTDLSYVPVQSWLRSMGASNPTVEATGQARKRASELTISDPGKLLLGRTLAVSSPAPNLRTRQIETVEFVVGSEDYIELYWPVFTSAVQIKSPDIFMRAQWNHDALDRWGTYVAAWVRDSDRFVPIDTWLLESGQYSPNDLYVSEIGFWPKYRDRSFGLLGRTILVAFVVVED